MTHTPGPWKVYRTKDGTAILGIGDAESGGITDANFGLWRSGEEREANARLIAAAPALLAIAQRWSALDGSAWHTERYDQERLCLLADTRAAIAKVEGDAR